MSKLGKSLKHYRRKVDSRGYFLKSRGVWGQTAPCCYYVTEDAPGVYCLYRVALSGIERELFGVFSGPGCAVESGLRWMGRIA